jgi:hypothetical protein
MIHYRDMTFCTFYEDCRDKDECHRPLTELVKLQANKWWNPKGTKRGPDCAVPEEAPIAVFSTPPPCHVKQTFKESVQELAKKLDRVPKEIREMSGVPSAIKKDA